MERGETDTLAVRAILWEILEPLARAGADQLILASTHFTFLQAAIRSKFGCVFGLVDSAAAVAGAVAAVLEREGLGIPAGAPGSTIYRFTGDPVLARSAVAALLNSVASKGVIMAEDLDVRSASA